MEQIGKRILFLDTIDSTNNYAIEKMRQNDMQWGDVVCAKHQTKGKGQRHKKWESKRAENLLCSVVLNRPLFLADQLFKINIVASLSVVDLLEQLGLEEIQIKWPNDIYVRQKKIAGILTESIWSQNKLEGVVLGIGLNVNQQVFETYDIPPTSVCLETLKTHPPKDILEMLLPFLDRNLQKSINDFNTLFLRYHARLYKLNKPVLLEQKNVYKQAVFKGVNKQSGAALLDLKGQIINVMTSSIIWHVD